MKRILLVVIAVVLALGGCRSLGPGRNALAVVNGDTITREDLEIRRKVYELFFRQSMDNPGSRQQLLDQMITEKLLLQQAAALQIRVTEAEVATELERFFGALARQYGSREEVLGQIQARDLTNDTLAAFIQAYLTSQATIERKRAEAQISPEEVQAYYEQNLDRLYTFPSDAIRAAHVLVPADQEDLAKEVSEKAKAGGDFAKLARLYSVDQESARSGGDLGYFTRGVMVQEFSEAAFALEVGEVSDPVRSQYGWHVIQLLDRQGSGVVPFERARENAYNRLLPQRQDQHYEAWLRGLQQTSRIERVSLTAAGTP